MKRLLFLAPSMIIFTLAWPGAGFWGPVIMLGSLIFLHELGHFLVAKWMKLPVEVFSLGFGTRLIGFKWQETDVRLSALPLGGYVKLMGYNDEDPNADDPNGFLSQPTWKRMLFYSGGIIFNVGTAVVLMFILATDQSRATPIPLASPLLVGEVLKDSAASQAGIKVEDKITAFGDLKFPGASDKEAIAYIQVRPGQPISVDLDREGKAQRLTVTPRDEGGVGRIGIRFSPSAFRYDRRPLVFKDFLQGAKYSVVGTALMARETFLGYFRLFTFRANIKELGGPIAIAKIGSEAAKAGWVVFLTISALISMNLAVLNALPIPFLDGGHIAMLGFERIRGRDLSISVKEKILTGGFVLLASLMVLVFALDIWKLKH
jgi:regulator of sigma E protease